MFIGVAGLIGAGKTRFTTELAGALGYETCYEPVEENPYLEDFYADMSRWTFNMQLYLLAERFRLHQEVIWNPCHERGSGVVQDRTIYEDTIFARMHEEDGLMDTRDFDVYLRHFQIMKRFLVYPDVIVYLRVSPGTAMQRIEQRGREAEKDIDPEYIRRLYDGYEDFRREMESYTLMYVVDWEKFRPVEDIAGELIQYMRKRRKFIRSLRRI